MKTRHILLTFILAIFLILIPSAHAATLTAGWEKTPAATLTVQQGESARFFLEGGISQTPGRLDVALFAADGNSLAVYAQNRAVTAPVLEKAGYTYTIVPGDYEGAGNYQVRAILQDAWGSSQTVELLLQVQQPKVNQKPVADAGGDRIVQVILGNTAIVLDGSKSVDADGDPLSYQWAQVSGEALALKDANAVKASFIPNKIGQYGFQLLVSDGKESANAQVKITVERFNRPPVSKVASAVLSGKVGEKVILDGSLSADPDGDALTYLWKQVAGTVVTLAATSQPGFTATASGTYVFELQVNDAALTSNTERVTVVVEAVPVQNQNKKPIAVIEKNFKVAVGTALVIDGSKSYDPEGKPLSYAWGVIYFPGENSFTFMGERSAQFSFTPRVEGNYTLGFKVNDGELDSEVASIMVIAEKAVQPPQPPVADFNVVQDSVELSVIRGGKARQNITIENKAADASGFVAAVKFNEIVDGTMSVNLLPGTAKGNSTTPFTLEVSASDGVDVKDYTGVVTITREGKSDSFALTVRVLPDVCPASSSSSFLKVTIREPKRGKDVKPGEVIEIDVDVKNTAAKDLDVGVEAELWNIKAGSVIASVEGDAQEIEKNEKESFEMRLEVPSNDDVNEQDDLVLFVRAFEDGEEERACSYEQKELDVKREDRDIAIADFVITPQVASCNQRNVNFRVGLENIGEKKDESVEIQLLNEELGLQLSEGPFTLKEFDESDNSIVKGLSFTLPREVAEGSYSILLDVLFHDGKEKKTLSKTLVVEECGGQEGLTPSLLSVFGEDGAAVSNEKVIPRGLSVSVLSEDNMIIAALIFGIALLLVAIVYAMKVLARG